MGVKTHTLDILPFETIGCILAFLPLHEAVYLEAVSLLWRAAGEWRRSLVRTLRISAWLETSKNTDDRWRNNVDWLFPGVRVNSMRRHFLPPDILDTGDQIQTLGHTGLWISEFVESLPRLKALVVEGDTSYDAAALLQLAERRKWKCLSMGLADPSDIEDCTTLSSLEFLELQYPRVSSDKVDPVCANIARLCPNLRHLCLAAQLEESDLVHLSRLPRLTSLTLSLYSGTRESLIRRIAEASFSSKLKQLGLPSKTLTTGHLKLLRHKLPRLQSIQVGVEHLEELDIGHSSSEDFYFADKTLIFSSTTFGQCIKLVSRQSYLDDFITYPIPGGTARWVEARTVYELDLPRCDCSILVISRYADVQQLRLCFESIPKLRHLVVRYIADQTSLRVSIRALTYVMEDIARMHPDRQMCVWVVDSWSNDVEASKADIVADIRRPPNLEIVLV